jgi:hypothetical protein
MLAVVISDRITLIIYPFLRAKMLYRHKFNLELIYVCKIMKHCKELMGAERPKAVETCVTRTQL